MSCPPHSLWFDQPNNIWGWIQNSSITLKFGRNVNGCMNLVTCRGKFSYTFLHKNNISCYLHCMIINTHWFTLSCYCITIKIVMTYENQYTTV
jgi:hypothetical protein